MAQHLKRWESPRRPGRNDKGRGGAARQRQLRKRSQGLRQRLRAGDLSQPDSTHQHRQAGEGQGSPFFSAAGLVDGGET